MTDRPQGVTALVRAGVRLTWSADRRAMTLMLAMQALTLVAVVGSALAARSLLADLLLADRTGDDASGLVGEVLVLAALGAVVAVATAVGVSRQRILAEQCLRDGEQRVLAIATAVPLREFDDADFHDQIERALQAVLRLPALVNALSALLRAAAGATGAVVALIVLAPAFAPLVLVALLPGWFAARHRGQAYFRFARELTAADRERRYLFGLLVDRDAAKEVRAYDLAPVLGERHGRLWTARLDALRRVADRDLRVSVVTALLGSLLIGGVLLALIVLALGDHLSLAGAGAAAGAVILLGQRLGAALSSAGGLNETARFLADYLALTGRPPAPARATAAGPAGIRVDSVSFTYAGAAQPALRDVSLVIEPGETVALVGENGSGKTTLAKLLAGLYAPDTGTVEAGEDVAVVFQDFLRLSLTGRDNVGLGRHERLPDDAGVEAAARAAGAHDALAHVGYDTVLDPAFAGGTDLSGGQWQRVALARMLFRDAPFVILDEPTAALDARAEHELFEDIRGLLADRTVLLISHRFPSVRTADRIHVMHAGAIVESGTHDELLARDGRYAQLFGMQAAAYR